MFIQSTRPTQTVNTGCLPSPRANEACSEGPADTVSFGTTAMRIGVGALGAASSTIYVFSLAQAAAGTDLTNESPNCEG